MKKIVLVLTLALALAPFRFVRAQESTPTPAELINEVNALRLANGLNALAALPS
ncbi:MAG: hypothetical protein HS124_06065 [Anaerolineales bacterium]|nr:hypothetical protein [Anaerolineales bacterium]MCL4261125.1 hypothetical protein [Anaerolineales bacterium]